MPVENESFYNILGEEISRDSIVQEMIDYYSQKLEIGETKVTDFNEGSEIRNLLESFAVDLYALMEDNYENTKIAFISTAYGEWLDLHGENPLIKLSRNTGSEAVGLVTFTISEPSEVDIIIPEETILICEENDLEYVTDSECVINAGETSIDVFCTCLSVGEDGNCDANTITIIDDENIDDSVSVSNQEAFYDGVDYEEDEEYRERLLDFIRSDNFGSRDYYSELGESTEGVHDILLVKDETYTRKVLVNGNVKPTSDEVLMDVLIKFTRPENIVLDHKFTVDRPIYHVINLRLDLDVEFELEKEIVEDTVKTFFDGGIASDGSEFEGFHIGENLIVNYFYSALENLDGILRAKAYNVGETTSSTSGVVFEPYSPLELSNIDINENEVLQIGTITINQTITE